MNAIDLRELSDRELFRYLLFGDLARPGWSGRRRQIALRVVEIAALTVTAVLALMGVAALFVLIWAAMLPAPR